MQSKINTLIEAFNKFYDETDESVHYKDKSISDNRIVFTNKRNLDSIAIDCKDDLEIHIIGGVYYNHDKPSEEKDLFKEFYSKIELMEEMFNSKELNTPFSPKTQMQIHYVKACLCDIQNKLKKIKQ